MLLTFPVLSIIIEHLPQFIIQIYVLFIAKVESFNAIVFAALVVNVIDIIFVATRGIMWIIIRITVKSNSNQVNTDDHHDHPEHDPHDDDL